MGIPKKNIFCKKKYQKEICDTMRPSTIERYGSEPTISDASCQVVYSKYTMYDVSYMRFHATCRGFSQRNGRVAGL